MKKNKLITLLLIGVMSLSVVACNKTNTNTNEIVQTPTQTPTIKPTNTNDDGIVFDNGSFILYEDGLNNYTDDVPGRNNTGIIPNEYQKVSCVLNHSFNYSPIDYKKIETSHLTFAKIAAVNNLAETEVSFAGYKFRTLFPNSFFSSKNLSESEIYEYDEELSEFYLYSSVEDAATNGLILTNVQEVEDSKEQEFREMAKTKNTDFYFSLVGDMVKVGPDSKYYIKKDGDFMICTFTNVIASDNHKSENLKDTTIAGTLTIYIDMNKARILKQFVGIDISLYNEGETSDAFNYRNGLNNAYLINKITKK
jgi:hypothetical protein